MSAKSLQCRVLGQISHMSRDVIVPKNNQDFKKKGVLAVRKGKKWPELVINRNNWYYYVLDDKNIYICLKNTSSEKVYLKRGCLDFLVLVTCDISVERSKEINFIKCENMDT